MTDDVQKGISPVDSPAKSWFIERRNAAVIILAAFFFLSGSTFFLIYEHHRSATEQAVNEDRGKAHLISLVLEEHLQRILKTMESYSHRPLLIRAVKGRAAEKAREHLADLSKNNPDIDSLVISDRAGTVWTIYPPYPGVIGKNFAHRDWYEGVSGEWKPYISDAVERIVGGTDPAVQICVPFYDGKGSVIGLLLNTQRTVRLGGLIGRVDLDPRTHAHVTDRKGRMIYSTRFSYKEEVSPFPFYGAREKAMALKMRTVAVEDPFLGGREQYISYAPVADVGWSVFIERDSRSVLLAERAHFMQMAAISSLLFLIIILSVLYFRKRVLADQAMEKLRVEESLRQSERRFRELFEHISSCVAVYDAVGEGDDFIFKDVNQAAEKAEGVDRRDVIGKSVLQAFPDVRDFGLFEVFQRVWRSGQPEHHPVSFYKDSRVEGWRENYVYKLPSGEIVAVYDDRTEIKRAEEALRESEERFRLIFDQAGDGILIADAVTRKFLHANKTMCAMLGYTQEGIEDLFVSDIHPPEDLSRVVDVFEKQVRGEIVVAEDLPVRRKDGSVFYADIGSALVTIGGRDCLVGIFRDTTERRTMQARLQQAQKMEAIGTLAGGIAHDFNNILMAIQGYISSLLLETDPEDPRHGKFRVIEGQVEAGAALARQLLGFARPGRFDVKPLNLNGILEKSASMFGRAKKEIVIHRKFQEDIWAVEADTARMEQVLMNLYLNAWQAMPSGGNLYLETENLTIAEIDVRHSYMRPGRYVKISVTDTGVGMDEKTRGRIFEPFFTTKELDRGTGLGLTMVYGIVREHGGFISVYSEVGKGTTFKIYLPATEKEAAREEKPSAEIIRGEETILLVDDEEEILHSMEGVMRMLGYRMLTAGSGPEALRVYAENGDKIDLVILDMIMPGMGGSETFDRLKAINPDVRVILSSGYSLNGPASEIMARGCRAFVQKPVNIADLSQKIREVLGGKM